MKKSTSLLQRLVTTLLVSLSIGGAIAAGCLYWKLLEEIDELFDARLRVIATNLKPEFLGHQEAYPPLEAEDNIVIQRWSKVGKLIYSSDAEIIAPRPTVAGDSEQPLDGDRWNLYSIVTSDGGWLSVAQPLSARKEMAEKSVVKMLLPFIIVLILVSIFTTFVIVRQLGPLRLLAEQIQRRGVSKRSRVAVNGAPRELEPVIHALNDLLERQANAAQQQRAFLADAAHELRTPLAAVSLQVERVQGASSPDDHREAVEALRLGVIRANRLVAQLLSLARSDSDNTTQQVHCFNAIDLETLLKTVLAHLYPVAEQKNIDMGLVESQPCVIQGDADGLRSLITNLLDNAIHYTPSGGRINVLLTVTSSNAELTISDNGPGIPAPRRQAVFERFVRDGTSDSSGTGLGLAIVRQVIEQHSGRITLDSGADGIGLTVRVSLPFGN